MCKRLIITGCIDTKVKKYRLHLKHCHDLGSSFLTIKMQRSDLCRQPSVLERLMYNLLYTGLGITYWELYLHWDPSTILPHSGTNFWIIYIRIKHLHLFSSKWVTDCNVNCNFCRKSFVVLVLCCRHSDHFLLMFSTKSNSFMMYIAQLIM